MTRLQICLVGWALLAAAGPAASWETLTRDIQLNCSQPDARQLDCRYRTPGGTTPAGITARSAGKDLPVTEATSYPASGALTAILFMVDTSDPGRQAVIDRNKTQIGELLKAARPHHRFGLATFDSTLQIIAPIGSAADSITAAAGGIAATGMTTELYRNVLGAIDALSRVPAERRAIIVFSDGQAEDEAYFHPDVVRAALQAGVIINSLGFPRSVARSVALQSLRRLSDETGGNFIESDLQYLLPADFTSRQFGAIDSGGKFKVNLAALAAPPAAARSGVELLFSMPTGPLVLAVPLEWDAGPAATDKAGPRSSAAEVRFVPVPAPVPAPRSSLDVWLSYGVLIALAILIFLTFVSLYLSFRRPAARATTGLPVPVDIKPLAYLISQDGKGSRFAIRGPVWRIGRSRDNELTLDDSSVSRRHAEIQRGHDGKFTVIDRDSTNGVYVNNEKISRRDLRDGDIVEIGDLSLRFSESPVDYPLAEDTAMLQTRAPRV